MKGLVGSLRAAVHPWTTVGNERVQAGKQQRHSKVNIPPLSPLPLALSNLPPPEHDPHPARRLSDWSHHPPRTSCSSRPVCYWILSPLRGLTSELSGTQTYLCRIMASYTENQRTVRSNGGSARWVNYIPIKLFKINLYTSSSCLLPSLQDPQPLPHSPYLRGLRFPSEVPASALRLSPSYSVLHTVHGRGNTEGLRLLSLQGPAGKVVLGWHLGTWISEVSPLLPN